MRRLFKWLIPLLLIAFGLLWPVVFRAAASAGAVRPDDPVVFSDYDAEFAVDADRRPRARWRPSPREFPSGRHGIFRYWDVTNQNNPRRAPDARGHLGAARR